MKRKLLTIIGFALFFSVTQSKLQAQESTKYAHGIGVAAGFTTGYGLSYRYTPGPVGVQLTFSPYSDRNLDQYSAGVTLLFNAVETEIANLYLYQGTSYFYTSKAQSFNNNDGSTTTRRAVTDYVNMGVGVGVELTIAKRVGLNLMTGYAAYNSFRKVAMTAESGIYFKF